MTQPADKSESLTIPLGEERENQMDEAAKKAFDFASETTKQILTLSTGFIALTITFSKDFVHQVPAMAVTFLAWGWLAFLLSIICGIWTLMALTGSLQPRFKPSPAPGIRGSNITRPAAFQILSFLAGIVLTICFGITSLCPLWPFC
jgi:hypothetical protein